MEPSESETDSHSFSSTEYNNSSNNNNDQEEEGEDPSTVVRRGSRSNKKVRFFDEHPEAVPHTFGPSETDTESESEDFSSQPLNRTTSASPNNNDGDEHNYHSNNNTDADEGGGTDNNNIQGETVPLNLTPKNNKNSEVEHQQQDYDDDDNHHKPNKYSKLKSNLFSMPRKLMNGTIFTSLGGSERAIDIGHLNDDDNNKSKDTKSNESALDTKKHHHHHDNQDGDDEVLLIKGLDDVDDDEAKELPLAEKLYRIFSAISKGIALIFLFYMFVCSLDILSDAFRLVGGRTASEIFKNSAILQNPIVGVMIGILTTILVQSSSTSTSIIVGMVAANFLEVQVAIPIIMGANIGTSITNTIVSFSQAGDRDKFQLAFAGATILDMFNWITVIVLLVVESATGYLYQTTSAILKGLMPDKQVQEVQLLTVLTNPFVHLIIQLDNQVMDCWAHPNCSKFDNSSLILKYCRVRQVKVEYTESFSDSMGKPIYQNHSVSMVNMSSKCDFIFAGTSFSDTAVGAILLVISLIVLCTCLIMIVKILSSFLQGHVAEIIKKTVNANIPYVPWLTGYIAILVGAIMTFLVQSSSVFTSALTPLIGLEVISLERAYPLTLGANVGTTATALLASMAVEGESFFPSMQIALCHVLFNVTGIVLFYPIPFLRFPLPMAKFLGKTTAKYRWFAIAYLVIMFAILPAFTIGLAFGGPIPVIIFCSILGIIGLIVIILTLIQRKRPSILPPILQTWKFLPLPLRSLEPYDTFFTKWTCCQKFKKKKDENVIKKIDYAVSSSPSSPNNTTENTQADEEHLAIQNLQESPLPRNRRRDLVLDKKEQNQNTYQFAEDEV